MCLGSKPVKNETSGTSSSTTTTDLPDYVTKGSETAVDVGTKLATDPWKAYEGKRVADLSDDTMSGLAGLKSLFEKMMGGTTGETAIGNLFDYAKKPAQNVGYEGTFDKKIDINPYAEAALNPVLRKIQEASDAARKRIGAGAVSAGSFGDARHGILESKNDANTSQAIGDTASQFFSSAYDKAVAARQADLNRKAGIDTTNAGLQEQALERLFKGSTGAISAEGANQQNMLQAIQALLGGGQLQTGQEQAKLDAEKSKHDETYNYQLSGLDALLKALKAPTEGITTQTGETTGTSTQTGGANPWLSILGGITGGLAQGIGKNIKI